MSPAHRKVGCLVRLLLLFPWCAAVCAVVKPEIKIDDHGENLWQPPDSKHAIKFFFRFNNQRNQDVPQGTKACFYTQGGFTKAWCVTTDRKVSFGDGYSVLVRLPITADKHTWDAPKDGCVHVEMTAPDNTPLPIDTGCILFPAHAFAPGLLAYQPPRIAHSRWVTWLEPFPTMLDTSLQFVGLSLYPERSYLSGAASAPGSGKSEDVNFMFTALSHEHREVARSANNANHVTMTFDQYDARTDGLVAFPIAMRFSDPPGLGFWGGRFSPRDYFAGDIYAGYNLQETVTPYSWTAAIDHFMTNPMITKLDVLRIYVVPGDELNPEIKAKVALAKQYANEFQIPYFLVVNKASPSADKRQKYMEAFSVAFQVAPQAVILLSPRNQDGKAMKKYDFDLERLSFIEKQLMHAQARDAKALVDPGFHVRWIATWAVIIITFLIFRERLAPVRVRLGVALNRVVLAGAAAVNYLRQLGSAVVNRLPAFRGARVAPPPADDVAVPAAPEVPAGVAQPPAECPAVVD